MKNHLGSSLHLLCGLASLLFAARARAANDPITTTDSGSSPATCRHRTVNYVTDTLPQQCIASPHIGQTDLGSIGEAITMYVSVTDDTVQPSRAVEDTSSRQASGADGEAAQNLGATITFRGVQTSLGGHISPEPVDTAPFEPSKVEGDEDSALDNVNFLSFEDWKKQNLAKSGQLAGSGRARALEHGQPRLQPLNNNGLDTLGDDTEIELDFSGFGVPQQDLPGGLARDSPSSETHSIDSALLGTSDVPSASTVRSKDAGHTCKERTNYASFDCAATVLKSNPECKSASSVLIENKDSYMLNVCSAPNKHLILELCDDILIDTVVLANYEFFSSIFHTFRLSVSDRYPPKSDKWRDLGVFEARNTRQVQAFLVEQPLIWARFLKIDFLSHYGNEYYCPVSLLRVHGTTMLEEFRHQEESSRADEPETVAAPEGLPDQAVAQEPAFESLAADHSAVLVEHPPTPTISNRAQGDPSSNPSSSSGIAESIPQCSNLSPSKLFEPTGSFCDAPEFTLTSAVHAVSTSYSRSDATTRPETHVSASSEKAIEPSGSPHASQSLAHTPSPSPSSKITSTVVSSAAQDKDIHVENALVANQSEAVSTTSKSSSTSVLSTSPSRNATSRHGTTATSGPSHPLATTQESFYKSIHKRLQMLESNATLSLQYIEEQSRILRDAFTKVERRQINKTEAFLGELNRTVLAELAKYRMQYDQLWQSTVIELQTHRDQYQQEILAVSSRLNLVAEELLFQKRMVIVQSTLLLLCLGTVAFARVGSTGMTLELPMLQQILAKSSSSKNTSSFYHSPASPSPDSNSPPRADLPSPNSWRHSWSDALRGRDCDSVELSITDGSKADDHSMSAVEMTFQPPTPTSSSSRASRDLAEHGTEEWHSSADDPEADDYDCEDDFEDTVSRQQNDGQQNGRLSRLAA